MTKERTIHNVASLATGRLDVLLKDIPYHQLLSEVLEWASRMSPPRKPLLSLAQDEFSHDVVIKYNDEIFLAYDVT